MLQSNFSDNVPADAGEVHAAIVMDGNGRWAERRGLPRSAGHRAGAAAVRRTVSAAAARGIGTLTLYAFSSDNWRRPAAEVNHLMQLFLRHLHSEAARCGREGIRVSVIGRRDRLGPGLLAAIDAIEERTRQGRRLHLQLAVDYSARDATLEAARLHGAAESLRPPGPRRTGGEQRLSDFMLWECAYAELIFTPRLGPDFGEVDLECALEEFRRRDRRFGGVPAPDPSRPGSHLTTAGPEARACG